MHRYAAVVAVAVIGSSAALAQRDPLMQTVAARLSATEGEFIAFRRDLHQHPEASGNEVRTAERVAARLRALGLEVRTGVGGHGVVAVLPGGRPGPVVAYRADMDAVMTDDADPVAFRSLTPGVRHICGHDLHTTIGLALATALHAVRAQLPGTVLFIFQPAEERATGAHAMLGAGVFGPRAPDAIYALHTAPLEVGQLGTIAGDLMSGRDAYRITLSGSGDLAAAAGTVKQRLDAIATITAEQSFAPAARDLILIESRAEADSAGIRTVQGTIMATALSRPRVVAAMAELRAMTRPNVTVRVDYRPKLMAGVTNDSALTPRAVAALGRELGGAATLEVNQIIPAFSEDFGAFTEQVPGTYFFLGVSSSANGTVGMPHTPGYVADEGAIQVGARAMAAVILDRLRR
ncbi:MAG: amidohydrolase [Gemmatimonadaceae bacterium]|nr:amidohydrolase [Gemmatimonadaceae bacterium]